MARNTGRKEIEDYTALELAWYLQFLIQNCLAHFNVQNTFTKIVKINRLYFISISDENILDFDNEEEIIIGITIQVPTPGHLTEFPYTYMAKTAYHSIKSFHNYLQSRRGY